MTKCVGRDVACAGTREMEGRVPFYLGVICWDKGLYSISLYYFPYFVLDYLFYKRKKLHIWFRILYFFSLD